MTQKEKRFEQSWAKYKLAIIAYATASRRKSQDLKRALRENGKFLCRDTTYITLLCVTFACLDCESSTALPCLAHFLLTLGAHVHEGYCSWVCVSVCLCVRQHLTSRPFFVLKTISRIQRATKVKIFVGFFSETASLPRSSNPSVIRHIVRWPFSQHRC